MSCPDDNEILGFLDGRFSDVEARRFEDHVGACADCRALVAELGRSLEPGEPAGRALPGAAASDHWQARSGGDVVGPGSRVGRFLVVDRIGAGAMGVVFRAHDPELERDIALKLIRVLGLAPDAAGRARARLLREAVAMARLAHPNVVAVHDASVVGDAVFVAMELVDGVDLARWLGEGGRGWREIVEVFIEAGRGLAAAHAAGVVHRDFKPQNVLIGPGARVRVTDFGLAALRGEVADEPGGGTRLAVGSAPEASAPLPAGADAAGAATALTRSGVTMGTPAYMSPEARAGAAVDERSDQYSLAVSLVEALSGERPDGPRLPPLRAPARVGRILARALSPEPARRYPSMSALVDALARARRSRLRPVLAAAAPAALAAAAALLLADRGDEPAPCTAGPARAAAVWSPGVRAALGEKFRQTGIGYAPDVFATAAAQLDRHAADWVRGYTEACEATHVRGEQSAALLDLRMQCLGDELRRFGAAVDLLGGASPAVVARAISIATLGDGLARCGDVAALTRETPRPVGPSADAAIDRISAEYDEVRAIALEGDQQEALRRAAALARAAEEVGYDRMEAEIVGYLGELQWRAGDLEAAKRSLWRAVEAAERARSDDIRAGTMLVLVAVIGFEEARHKEALEIARLAELALRARGDRGRLANLTSNRGSIHFGMGDIDAAEADYKAARDLMLAEYGPEDPRTGQILNNVALIAEERGRHAEAVETYGQALAIYRAALGPRHPQIALTLANRATSLANLERLAEATADLEQALAIRREVHGAEHPEVGTTHRIMAQLAIQAGELDRALAEAGQARAILGRALPDDHPEIAATRAVTGQILERLGRHAEAIDELTAALGIWQAREVTGALPSMSRFRLARAMWAAGRDRPGALALARRARQELDGDPDSAGPIDEWLRGRR